jgi:hypothetical protein
MIQLKPIDAAVQKTLIEKIKQSGKKERPVNEPLSGDKGNYMQARTTWARMISLSVPKGAPNEPVVISAGEEKVNLSDSNVTDILESVDKNLETQKIGGQLRGDFYDVYQKNNYHRPIAGLKGISTRIQGQSKAVRTAEIKWICWDFDTLERLTPYFLSAGVSVALEFGWMWPGHTPNEFIYDNWKKLDARKIGDLSKVVRSQGKGNQELVYGIIKNFSWTGRDDGGFDCVTEIVSPSSNVFGAQMGDTETAPSFEIPADLKNQIRSERAWGKSRAGELKKITDSAVMSKALKESFPTDGIQNIPPKLLFENFQEVLLGMKYEYEDGGVLEAGGNAGWGNNIESVNKEFDDTIIVELVAWNTNSNIEERYLGPYITYGWFEDNILSRFVSKIHDGDKIGYQIRSVDYKFTDKDDGIDYYESVKINNDAVNLLTLNAKEVIIPGQWPMEMDFSDLSQETGEISDTSFSEDISHSHNVRQALVRLSEKVKGMPAFNVEPIDEESLKKRDPLGRAASKAQFRKLKNRDISHRLKIDSAKDGEALPKDKGYLRNLLIHSKIIQEEMANSNTLEDGLKNLMKRISSSCGGIWDFKLTSDLDNEFQVKIIEDSSTEQPVRGLLKNKSLDMVTGEIADNYVLPNGEIAVPGLFVFPTWQTNSIVYNQSMVTKLPSQMATAAIYGRNMGNKESAIEDLSLEPAAKAIGKLFNAGMEEPKNPEDKIVLKMERILGNSDFSNWGYNALPKDGLVPAINVNANYVGDVKGTTLDVEKIVQIYTQKQIMELLEDGVDAKEEKGFWSRMGDKISSWWENSDEYRYLYSNSGTLRKHYQSALMYFLKQSPSSLEKTKDVMTPIELSVTIDGTGGIFAGEAFSSSYIPKRYREACVFQIMDVAHELDTAGWKTTLRGLMRIDYGFGAKKPVVEQLKEMLKNEEGKTNPNDPPYLNFSDYLTKNIGKISPFKIQPPKAEVKEHKDSQLRKNVEAEDAEERRKENLRARGFVIN